MSVTNYRRTGSQRVTVTLWCPFGDEQYKAVNYWVDESDDSVDAAMHAEAEHPGCYYDSWEYA